MDASDKILTYNTLEDLMSAVEADVKSKDVLAQRYCVRFIMLNSFDAFRRLSAFLKDELCVNVVNLEDKPLGPDKTIDNESLLEIIRDVKNSSMIAPFSELVRFYPDEQFLGFFNDVILTEDIQHPGKRIYIPIIGLQNRFNDFIKNFARIAESAPIWRYSAPQDDQVTVYVSKYTDFKIPEHHHICSLPTMRDWLKFWKGDSPQDKILCGATPIRSGWKNSRPDSIFTFKALDNAHEFITEFLEVNIPIPFVEDDLCHWEQLLSELPKSASSSFSFRGFVEDRFNRKSLTISDILCHWAEPNVTKYGRWLLKFYALSQNVVSDYPYLTLVLSETNDLLNAETLFVNIAQRIFYFTSQAERDRHCDERKLIMQSDAYHFTLVPAEHQTWIEDNIVAASQQESNFRNVKKLCTSTFTFERRLFLGWYLCRTDAEFNIQHVQDFYPDLHAYICSVVPVGVNPGYEWVHEYFDKYRTAKMADIYTEDIANAIEVQNKCADTFFGWYYKFKESHNLLDEFCEDSATAPDKIYWIDGLGAEFIPYVLYLIEQAKVGYEPIHIEIARTTIPSNTSINSFDVDGSKIFKCSELDELAHEGVFKKYDTLIRELDVIKTIVNRILADNKIGNHTIAIVSDHGLSSLSRKVDSLKHKCKTHHEGRYVELSPDDPTTNDDNFIVGTNPRNNKRYMVALKHASLGTKPIHEVHGGATPEEVLVPFIVITNNDKSKPITYKITPLETKVPISSKEISFGIMPDPKSVDVHINGKKYKLNKNNMKWSATIDSATEGKHTITVLPNQGKPQNFEFEFYGMGFGGSLIDDDF